MSTDTTPRPTYTKVMTPKGTLVYPSLNKPDFKFKKDFGEFSARIRLGPDESAPLIEKINAEMQKALAAAKAELDEKLAAAKTGQEKAKAKKLIADLKLIDPPFKPAVDDDGDETGEYVFNFKMPGGFASKKEKDSEGKPKTIAMRPDLFDAKGKPIKNPPPIWGGTVAIVAGELRPFLNPKAECGVSLRLRAVQVIELRSGGGGGGSASEYGFGAEEGYEASDEPSMGDHAPAPDGDDSAPAGGQDF